MVYVLKILLLLSFTYSLYAHDEKEIFTNNIKFIIGQYSVEKEPHFVNLKTFGIPTSKENLYLQKEVAEQLLKMFQQLKHDIPSAKFWVVSATRTYWEQKKIWENKYHQYKRYIKNERDIVKKILEYSSMPGTSRHHWGTDFDINILENQYYEEGEGKKIYEWLLKHAKNYGFCMPYNKNRTSGYNEERWHWSYIKLSKIYLEQWNDYFNKKILYQFLNFKGKKYFEEFAPIYVNSINEECMNITDNL